MGKCPSNIAQKNVARQIAQKFVPCIISFKVISHWVWNTNFTRKKKWLWPHVVSITFTHCLRNFCHKKIRIRFDFLRFRICNKHFDRKEWWKRKKKKKKKKKTYENFGPSVQRTLVMTETWFRSHINKCLVQIFCPIFACNLPVLINAGKKADGMNAKKCKFTLTVGGTCGDIQYQLANQFWSTTKLQFDKKKL